MCQTGGGSRQMRSKGRMLKWTDDSRGEGDLEGRGNIIWQVAIDGVQPWESLPGRDQTVLAWEFGCSKHFISTCRVSS